MPLPDKAGTLRFEGFAAGVMLHLSSLDRQAGSQWSATVRTWLGPDPDEHALTLMDCHCKGPDPDAHAVTLMTCTYADDDAAWRG